jgi:uncharacterized protein (DUF427 family)
VNAADKSAVEWKVNRDLLRHNVRVTWNGMNIADIERPEGMWEESFNREHNVSFLGL